MLINRQKINIQNYNRKSSKNCTAEQSKKRKKTPPQGVEKPVLNLSK